MTGRSTSENQNQVSLKELREEFYKIRKFEIQNLWQRSIFLATFIVLLFTGYGTFFEKLMSYDGLQSIIGHIICSLLALTGCIFSILWIMMAKGSKAWFEIYERKIGDIEKEETLNIPENYRMQEDSPDTEDNSLRSLNAGSYSVSKINVLLGQVLWGIWISIFCLHTLSLSGLAFFTYQDYEACTSIAIVISAASLLLLIYLTIKALPNELLTLTKSTAIKIPTPPEKKQKTEGKQQEEQSSPCASSSNAPAPQPSTSTE